MADRDGDGVADADVVAEALADADREIDGYLAGRYQVPLSPVPDVVKAIACRLARHALHRDGRSDDVRQDYRDAIRRLEAIRDGDFVIDVGAANTEPVVGRVRGSEAPRVFTADTLRGFQ